MHLPNLSLYRIKFADMGVSLPLKAVCAEAGGLLNRFPEVSGELTGWPWAEQTHPSVYGNKTDWPKITIVTPSYNQAAFLEQTIRSVLLQNYPDLEFIVIDGGSTDGSVEILKRYSQWISYWQSEKDEGQAQAINMGLSLASGDYCAWINSDDYYLPGTLHTVAQTFLRTHADFVYGYTQNYHVATGVTEMMTVPPLLDYFIKIPSLAQPSCFWRTAINKPLWEEMHCALDYELWLRLVPGHKRHRIRQALSVANVHDEAKTSDPAMQRRWHEDHVKMWSAEGHGPVPEWKRVVFLNRIRMKFYKLTGLL